MGQVASWQVRPIVMFYPIHHCKIKFQHLKNKKASYSLQMLIDEDLDAQSIKNK